MEERLRSRFQGGMVTSIDPPDLETRTAILRKKAELEHVDIEKDAVDFIASNVSENIRELEGAFVRVLMEASEEKSAITLELTQRALKDVVHEKEEKKYITIDEIQQEICRFYKIRIDDLLGKKKNKSIALPRQIAMYLCREMTSNTYPHIGKAFGGRDHTTVMHACDKVTKMMEKEKQFQTMIEKLTHNIRGVDN
jgi:chromosomal replication initiator protein